MVQNLYQPLIFLFLVLSTVYSCQSTQKIEGLWIVEKVQIGNQEMTPVARWSKFNLDQTQSGGNGWRQHSIGTWQYDAKTSLIELTNENGPRDEFGAFKIVDLSADKMHWSREEEGQEVHVFFKQTNRLPTAPFDQLIGVWKYKENNKGQDEKPADYLFFRWDQTLVSKHEDAETQYGIYKTHGHRPEIQLIYYGDPMLRSVWSYRFEDGSLILEQEVEGKQRKMEYQRTDFLPR